MLLRNGLVQFACFVTSFVMLAASNAQSVAARAPVDAARGVLSYADIVEPSFRSVVLIQVEISVAKPKIDNPFFDRYFDKGQESRTNKKSAGSGFVVDAARGFVLTASFVVDNAKEANVTFDDGRVLVAKVVASDTESQIALLKVDAENLTALKWADSNLLRVGDVLFAVGYPYAIGRMVTSGVVSGISSSVEQVEFRNLIVTDATIASGYAGGPMLNSKGEVVGVAVAILSRTGDLQMSFGVPAAVAQRVVKDLIEYGRVKHPSLGVTVREVGDQNPADGIQVNQVEVIVDNVRSGSAAERVGLLVGDVILRAAGKSLRGENDLRRIVQSMDVGEALELTYRRHGAERTVSAILEEAPSQ